MVQDSTREQYSVELIIAPCDDVTSAARVDLTLVDHQIKGCFARGEASLDFMGSRYQDFVAEFLAGEIADRRAGLAFGSELAERLFASEGLGGAWARLNERRGELPLRLELVFPPHDALSIDGLPFELLADAKGFWFRRPGWSLVRTFEGLRARTFELARQSRAIVAWANPTIEDGEGRSFSLPDQLFAEHEVAFEGEGKSLGIEVRAPLRQASLGNLGDALRERPATPLLSILAHGDPKGGGLLLHVDSASDEGIIVEARPFAKVCRDGGVKIVLLWSCHGARHHRDRSSVAAAVLDPDHGDAAAVVAAHAELTAGETAALVRPLLRSLADVAKGDFERAVAEARHGLPPDDLQWAAPIYYARPYQGRSATIAYLERDRSPGGTKNTRVEGSPALRPWFRGRKVECERARALLDEHRLVTIEGAPGAGKTSLAVAVSAQVLEQRTGGVERAVWIDLPTMPSTEVLRETIALLFAFELSPRRGDFHLARALKPTRALLVLDNAEELLDSDGDALRSLLDTLVRYTDHLRVLVTSRQAVGALEGAEEQVLQVLRLPKGDDMQVFRAAAGKRLAAVGGSDTELLELVSVLEGHPQSLVLVASQIGRGLSLDALRERVKAEDAEIIRDAELVDEDIIGSSDQRLRRSRLINSLDLSLRPLMQKMPPAAEIFAWLGSFPAGLPEPLLRMVFGAGVMRYIGRLVALNLVEYRDAEDRFLISGPLRWYARYRQYKQLDGIDVVTSPRLVELRDRSTIALASWLRDLQSQLGLPGAATATVRARPEGSTLLALCVKPSHSRGASAAFVAYADLALHGGYPAIAVAVGEQVRAILGSTATRGGAHMLQRLGALYVRTNRLTEAERVSEEALAIFQAIEDLPGEAEALGALGDLYIRVDRLMEGERAYNKALAIYRASAARLGEANTLRALGEVYDDALSIYRAVETRLGEARQSATTMAASSALPVVTHLSGQRHEYSDGYRCSSGGEERCVNIDASLDERAQGEGT